MTDHRTLTRVVIAAAALTAVHVSAGAQSFLDFAKTRTESRDTFLVYDLADFAGSASELKEQVRQALTYQGDNAHVHESAQTGSPPTVPGKLTLKQLGANLPVAVSFSIPSCAGAVFSVSSSDDSLARWGDSSNYMACGFRYSGGYRVDFYARYQTTRGGVMGILSGKTVAKVVTGMVGMNSDPQKYIESSIARLEELMTKSGWSYAIVEMNPAMPDKVLAEDPISSRVASNDKRTADRSKRLAARSELVKLGIDASDRARLIRAVEGGDEDVISLFTEAGAIDMASRDASGKTPMDYAATPEARERLFAKR